METFYMTLFGSLVMVAILLNMRSASAEHDLASNLHGDEKRRFRLFRNNYLIVFCMMMAGDWLQGPYIYALYEHYGYSVGHIGQFFIMGFGSSLVFGTVVGSLADIIGRRSASLCYVATYCLSCLTKHSSNYWLLMLGRLLGGISTSLLFSVFESWLVAEHNRRGFPEELLADTFSKAVFLGAGLVAILAGLAGNLLVEELRLGPVAPFDAAILVMLAGGALVASTWTENFGDGGGGGPCAAESGSGGGGFCGGVGGSGSRRSLGAQLQRGWAVIRSDPRVALLGAMQSLFEASMYTFVFLWTPALSPRGEKIPHGLVFACFMTACMAGSAGTGLLVQWYGRRYGCHAAGKYMLLVYAVSAASLMVPLFFHMELRDDSAVGSSLADNGAGGISAGGKVQLLAFCAFEACIGVFWPSMMALRAVYVPEELRATIINIFRIPLNLFVCVVLFKVSAFPLAVMFAVCVGMLVTCMACQSQLNSITVDLKVSDPHADADLDDVRTGR